MMELNELGHEVSPELALEEALEGDPHSDPAHYLATMMPSRMALRSNQGLTLTRRTLAQNHNVHGPSTLAPLRSGRRFIRDVVDSSNVNLIQMTSLTRALETEEYEMEELMEFIQNMTAPIEVKRRYYRVICDRPTSTESCSKLLKARFRLFGAKVKNGFSVALSYVALWRHSLHHIEGHYGVGLVTAFRFIKMLLLLNLAASIFIILFVILPSKLAAVPSNGNQVTECMKNYTDLVLGSESSNVKYIQDFLQGTGWMELGETFYGFYTASWDDARPTGGLYYNVPLAYLLVILLYFLASLLLIVLNAAHNSHKSLFLTRGRFYEGFATVFTSWDFCISDVRKARVRHDAIYNESTYIISQLLRRQARKCRTAVQSAVLLLVRAAVNIAVLAILAASGAAIYLVTNYAFTMAAAEVDASNTRKLMFEFLPSLIITGLNLVVPLVFTYLVKVENYSQDVVVGISLVRMVFLRLASLGVLLASVYHLVNCPLTNSCGQGSEHCKNPPCWETYVGQQLYKLCLLDFFVAIATTFVVELPRRLIHARTRCAFVVWLGPTEFDIPRHILDTVYSQAICWLGAFYAPLLPIVTVIKYFAFYYLKKFSLFVTSVPGNQPFRASKSNTFFTIALLASFLIAVLPVGYAIGNIHPAKSCGPFHAYEAYWDVVAKSFANWPYGATVVVNFLVTPGFTLPTFLALILAIYYFNIQAAAHKHALLVLEDQLVLMGREKQILMKQIHRTTGTLKATLGTRNVYTSPI